MIKSNGEKLISLVVMESEDKESLGKVLSQVKDFYGINIMDYQIEDSRLRMIFAALKEGVTSSQ